MRKPCGRLPKFVGALALTMIVAAPFAQVPLAAQNGQERVKVLIAFRNTRRITEQDDADFGFLEVEGETKFAAWEFDHFVQHHLAQALDAGDAIARGAHDADIAFLSRGFQPRDLRFDFFQDAAHDSSLG